MWYDEQVLREQGKYWGIFDIIIQINVIQEIQLHTSCFLASQGQWGCSREGSTSGIGLYKSELHWLLRLLR
jgi:hypothetical protein